MPPPPAPPLTDIALPPPAVSYAWLQPRGWVGGTHFGMRDARTCGRALEAKKDSPSADRNR